jgi:tripartite-type tricarboxylate transporter receptor subunit TctC
MKLRFALTLFMSALAVGAQAQGFPNKTVRLVVPFAAGGSTDIVGRILAQKLNEMWGQPVIVDNRAGGGTVIGTDIVVISKINADVLKVVRSPELVEKLKSEGSDPVGSSVPDYAAFLRDEIAKWAKVIKFANVKGLSS